MAKILQLGDAYGATLGRTRDYVLEMLLGMLEFLLFHEISEVMKDVSLMHAYENEKHGGYGNERSLCRVFLLFRDNAECFIGKCLQCHGV